MPRLQAPLRRPWRAAAAPVIGLLASLTGASCESLYGSYSMDNQDNCVVNAALCPAPEQVCNLSTKLCEPATLLTAVDPPSGSNLGGTMVTITGSRFADGMSVNIDGVPATSVVVTGAQQLTAITPARPSRQGLVTVELINPEGQHALKDKLFRYYGGVTFSQKCLQGPSGSNQLVVTDLNGDRKSDLLVANFTVIRPYVNSGDGQNFQAMADIKPSQQLLSLVAADLNGDGKVDLIVPAATATNSIFTGLGNGDGTFATLVKTSTAQPAYGLAVADLNGDQRLDVASLQDLALVVQPGAGDGTLLAAQSTTYTAQSSRPGSTLNLVDIDGDGLLDALPLNPVEQGFNILFGQAGGAWATPMTLGLSANPYVGYIGDYTQDGVLDILIAYSRPAAKVGLLQGLGGRRFSALPDVPLNSNFRMQAQGDFNGDGLADLATMDAGTLSNNLVIYLGTGGGHFVALPILTVPVGPTAAAVGDFDGDGRQDLVTLSSMGDSICVLRSLPQ